MSLYEKLTALQKAHFAGDAEYNAYRDEIRAAIAEIKQTRDISKALDFLKFCDEDGDTEVAHSNADKILCAFVPKELAEAWDKVGKWYA